MRRTIQTKFWHTGIIQASLRAWTSNIRVLAGFAVELFIEFSGESPGMGLDCQGVAWTRRGNA